MFSHPDSSGPAERACLEEQRFSLQAHWDEAYENEYPLWRAYHHCVDFTRKKNSERRKSSYNHLKLPDGREFAFTKEGRQGLDPTITQTIRCRAPSPVLHSGQTLSRPFSLAKCEEDSLNGRKLQILSGRARVTSCSTHKWSHSHPLHEL